MHKYNSDPNIDLPDPIEDDGEELDVDDDGDIADLFDDDDIDDISDP